MSGFIGAAMPVNIIRAKDERLHPPQRQRQRQRQRQYVRVDAFDYPKGYANAHWPGNRGFIGDYGADVGVLHSVWSGPVTRIAWGAASRVGFVGVSRDQYGAPLGGVTCSLFLTATRAWIMDIVSDASGNFLLQSWYSPAAHFIVFYRSGSPDVFGTTQQTLVGA